MTAHAIRDMLLALDRRVRTHALALAFIFAEMFVIGLGYLEPGLEFRYFMAGMFALIVALPVSVLYVGPLYRVREPFLAGLITAPAVIFLYRRIVEIGLDHPAVEIALLATISAALVYAASRPLPWRFRVGVERDVKPSSLHVFDSGTARDFVERQVFRVISDGDLPETRVLGAGTLEPRPPERSGGMVRQEYGAGASWAGMERRIRLEEKGSRIRLALVQTQRASLLGGLVLILDRGHALWLGAVVSRMAG